MWDRNYPQPSSAVSPYTIEAVGENLCRNVKYITSPFRTPPRPQIMSISRVHQQRNGFRLTLSDKISWQLPVITRVSVSVPKGRQPQNVELCLHHPTSIVSRKDHFLASCFFLLLSLCSLQGPLWTDQIALLSNERLSSLATCLDQW